MTNTRGRIRWAAGAALALGLALRLGYFYFGTALDQQLWSDMLNYVNTADAIGQNKWLHYHFFQPIGYPYLVLLLKKFTPESWGNLLSILQSLLSLGIVVLVWRTASATFSRKVALVSLFVAAIHLPWIYLTNYALPETVFTFLMALCAWLSVRVVKAESAATVPAFAWGACFAAALWLKGTHALLGPFFVAGLVLYNKRRSVLPALALCLPVAAGLGLHGALSYSKVGKFRMTSTNGGLNFTEGKCPEKKNTDTTGRTFFSPLYHQLGQSDQRQWDQPFTYSGYYWRQGLACIQEEPFVLIQSLEGIPYLFFGNTTWPLNFMPGAAKERLYELAFSLFLICGLASYVREAFRRFDPERTLIWDLPIVALCLCVYIFKSEVRFRVPFDVWLIPMAVAGWASFLSAAAPHPAGPTDETP